MTRDDSTALRTYKAPWRGELVLVCNKCQRKWKKRKHGSGFSSVKKWFKKRGKADEDACATRVVGVDCLKLCPKDGVTVSSQHQLGEAGAEVSIVQSAADLERLYAQLQQRRARRGSQS